MTANEIESHPWLKHEDPEHVVNIRPLVRSAAQLSRSERGLAAAAAFREFLNRHAGGLDGENRNAINTLLQGYFGSYAGSVDMLLELVGK